MKHLIWLAAAVLTLAACDNSVNGTLTIDNAFQIQTNDGDVVNLDTGAYASTLTMKNSKTIDVTFKMNGTTEDIRIRLPKGATLPTDGNGPFAIKGSDVGMTFDTAGTLSTAVENGKQQQGQASCYMPPPPPECFPGPQGETSCVQQPAQQGFMTVIYHLQTTTTKVSAEFTSPVNAGHLASFTGSNSDTVEVYDYQGSCNF